MSHSATITASLLEAKRLHRMRELVAASEAKRLARESRTDAATLVAVDNDRFDD